jgi:hypothetical protein
MAADGDRGEGDVDVDRDQTAGVCQARHRGRRVRSGLAAGQQHLTDLQAQVEHLEHPLV